MKFSEGVDLITGPKDPNSLDCMSSRHSEAARAFEAEKGRLLTLAGVEAGGTSLSALGERRKVREETVRASVCSLEPELPSLNHYHP